MHINRPYSEHRKGALVNEHLGQFKCSVLNPF